MKVVRSDTPEVARCIASGGTRASRHWPALAYGSQQNIIILLIAVIVSFSVSVRAAVWLGLSALLVWNAYVLWWTKSSRLNWCIAVCPERVYLRLFMMRGGARHCADSPDVVVLAASEIASMSIRTVEVFLYGPKPKSVECLVIEPAHAVAEGVSNHIRPLLRPLDAGKVILVANEEGRLAIGSKWCHPPLRGLLQQIVRECPSVVIGCEEHSELDLNGIWHGTRESPDAQQRRMLLQAKRLGFGSDCAWLLSVYRRMSPWESDAFMAEIEQEEAGT